MRDLRIVFMGTPDFAVATLTALVEAKYNIVGVITAPDRRAGRGKKINTSAVKKYALENDLPLLQPTNLKDSDFLVALKSLKANLQIVVAFRMLPTAVWSMPEYGTFNLHASLLPDYRGAAPINWAVINGDTETGVTTFFIDDKIDTGEIILQKKTHIGADETAGSLHDRLMQLGADLVLQTVTLIKQVKVSTTKQPENTLSRPAYKIFTETCKIDWEASGTEIHNLVRGLSPYPVAWSNFKNGDEEAMMKIYGSSFEAVPHELSIGKLLFDKKELKVAVKNGYLKLLEIQLPGKRKMMTSDLLNGYEFKKNARML